MFGITGYKLFLISSVLMNMTPGSDTIYVLTKSGVGGRKCGIASALGISTGILVHTLLAALGLSVILAKSAAAFNIMKLAGAVYLTVMGIRTIISKKPFMEKGSKEEMPVSRVYAQGVLTNVLNPKAALFFLALLPQFVSADNGFGPVPFVILGLTFFATSTLWSLFLAYISSFVSRILNSSERVGRAAAKLSGVIYIMLGLNILRAKIN